MEKVIYNLVFNRKKRLNAEGKALIQIEAYLNRQKKYFSTKIYVKPSQWDSKRRVVRNHPNMDELNQYIEDYIAYLERIELDMVQSGRPFSLKYLRERGDYDSSSFISFMKNEIERSNLRMSTLKNHLSTLQVLCQYQPEVAFDDLTFNFLCDFERFLLEHDYHRNTIAKHMKHLKRYINLAINKDLFELQKYPFRKYKIKYMESKRGHLTPEELDQLEKVAPKLQRTLRRTLDMFLFSCYTGLRFSDIVNIKPDNFQLIDDKLWLVYSSVKTDVNVRLPLFLLFDGKALFIYERYRRSHSKTLFGVSASANSNVNKQLKRICRLAEIDKKLSFHMARHTNATLLLYNGANITTVQKLLGHKSVRTTEIYSDIMDMTVIRDLENISLK
ncbi:site-specific integrase [uncultured Parabacteroides sp.]|uniref:site-specific integrase n=1 Tax=uncultured Parabacteroides sp. TaxID=512312 RepID=UPI0025DE31B0|nr:site-specific integrase [uncultured Parabacteroides sp.]